MDYIPFGFGVPAEQSAILAAVIGIVVAVRVYWKYRCKDAERDRVRQRDERRERLRGI